MANYTGPKVRLSRRVGVPIEAVDKHAANERVRQPPGIHGFRGRRPRDYGIRLTEKQKLRFHYNVNEGQFRRFVKEAKRRMVKSAEHLEADLKGIRTGRANVGLVDHIKVDYYGSMTPIGQLATVSTPDPKTIVVKPFDTTQIGAIEKAILGSDLGITPQADGKLVRLPVPLLTKEQRQKLAAHVRDLAEAQRVAIRNIRRHVLDEVKKEQKDGDLPEDDAHRISDEIQKVTDDFVHKIDEALKHKEEEIMEV